MSFLAIFGNFCQFLLIFLIFLYVICLLYADHTSSSSSYSSSLTSSSSSTRPPTRRCPPPPPPPPPHPPSHPPPRSSSSVCFCNFFHNVSYNVHLPRVLLRYFFPPTSRSTGRPLFPNLVLGFCSTSPPCLSSAPTLFDKNSSSLALFTPPPH